MITDTPSPDNAHPDGRGDADDIADPPSPDDASPETDDRPGLFSRFFSGVRQRSSGSLRDDLTDALSSGQIEDTESFTVAERAMLNNILRLREVRVEDVMIPRVDIEAIDVGTPLGDLLKMFEQSGHSRMPVYAETLDDPRGMIHIRDAVAFLVRQSACQKGPDAELDLGRIDLATTVEKTGIIRPILFVPPSMAADDLMAHMQASRTQMALVIDEYGGTDGLVSLEDIVEVVVGDIEDEHDVDEDDLILRRAEGIYLVDARAEIDEVAKQLDGDFNVDEELLEDVDTIGGLVFNALSRVPARGEVVQAVPGWEFHVIDADPRRVKRIRMVRLRGERRRRPSRSSEVANEAEAHRRRPEDWLS